MTTHDRVPDGPMALDRSGQKNDKENNGSHINPEEATVGKLVSGLPHLRLRPDCPAEDILSAMTNSGRKIAGIIEEDGRFVGFITRSALLGKMVMDQGLDKGGRHIAPAELKTVTAADVMIRNPAFLPSELGLSDALAIMTEYGYHAMPVLGDHGQLVGLAEMRQLRQAQRILNSAIADQQDQALSHLVRAKPIRTRH